MTSPAAIRFQLSLSHPYLFIFIFCKFEEHGIFFSIRWYFSRVYGTLSETKFRGEMLSIKKIVFRYNASQPPKMFFRLNNYYSNDCFGIYEISKKFFIFS